MMSKDKIPSLDLHGFTEDEVFDAIEGFLKKNAQRDCVRIIHGKGAGVVKAKVHEYLKLAHYKWRPDKSDSGLVNEGSLLVDL